MSYPIPDGVYDVLQQNPEMSGADLSRKLGLKGRTARRYVKKFREGKAIPKERSFVPTHIRSYKAPRVLLRSAVFDIEVTDFSTEGFGGIMILTSILPLDSDEVKTIGLTFDDQREDRRALLEIREELSKYDILIGHNIAAFDIGWLNSRLMYHRLPLLPTHLYYDTYQVAKALAIKTRKSLGNLLDYFGIPGVKTSIYRTSWTQILSPHREEFEEAYNDIKYHCEQDVVGTRNLFDVLYPYSLANGRNNPMKLSKMRTT